MRKSMKVLVVGAVPVACASVVVPALGEKIGWPEIPSPKLSFQAAPPSAAAQTAAEADAMRVRMEAEKLREIELEMAILRARVQVQLEPMYIDGHRP